MYELLRREIITLIIYIMFAFNKANNKAKTRDKKPKLFNLFVFVPARLVDVTECTSDY